MQFSRRYVETLNGVEHEILLEEDAPAVDGAGARVPVRRKLQLQYAAAWRARFRRATTS